MEGLTIIGIFILLVIGVLVILPRKNRIIKSVEVEESSKDIVLKKEIINPTSIVKKVVKPRIKKKEISEQTEVTTNTREGGGES